MLLYAKQNTIGGRSYPVCHYPVAIRLRDRKGRAILCLRLSSKWGLVGRCTRSAFRRTPSPTENTAASRGAYISKWVSFLPVLCTLYIAPLCFVYMPHYASICCLSPYTKHRIIFYLAKKNTYLLAYVQFLLYLCSRFKRK